MKGQKVAVSDSRRRCGRRPDWRRCRQALNAASAAFPCYCRTHVVVKSQLRLNPGSLGKRSQKTVKRIRSQVVGKR